MKEKQIDPMKLMEIIDFDYNFIDIRTEFDFKREHIKNFINIPYTNTEQIKRLSKFKKIILLCYSGKLSFDFSTKLNNLGFDSYSIKGGFEAVVNPIDKNLY